MSIVRWDPFEKQTTLRRSVDRLFDTLLTHRPLVDIEDETWEPAIEMFEDANGVVIRVALPNIDPKHLDITVADNRLTLKGEMRHEEEEKKRTYYRRELLYGSFARVLPLPANLKDKEAKATYKNGVLEIKVPKSEKARPVNIKVRAAA